MEKSLQSTGGGNILGVNSQHLLQARKRVVCQNPPGLVKVGMDNHTT